MLTLSESRPKCLAGGGPLERSQAYPLTEDGRKAIMADVEQILRDSERRSAAMFLRTPKARVVAQPFPRFREANAAANYTAPAPDGSRPGTFQIPLRRDRMTKFACVDSMPAVGQQSSSLAVRTAASG